MYNHLIFYIFHKYYLMVIVVGMGVVAAEVGDLTIVVVLQEVLRQ
jgi:hypothetical protein